VRLVSRVNKEERKMAREKINKNIEIKLESESPVSSPSLSTKFHNLKWEISRRNDKALGENREKA